MNKKQFLTSAATTAAKAGGVAAISLMVAFPAFAATTATTTPATKTHHHAGKTGTATAAHTHKTLTNAAFGKVASVNGSSFTITHKTKTGTKTVTIGTTSATTFKQKGQVDSLANVTVGERVVAMGVKDSSGNIAAATSVNIIVPHAKK